MATDRTAEVTWNGDLMSGSGRVDSVTHGACFSMALSHTLGQAGHPADELKSSATVTFQPGEGIQKIALQVEGNVPGMSEDDFRQAAETAKENCPVSKALAGVPEITLDARLQS